MAIQSFSCCSGPHSSVSISYDDVSGLVTRVNWTNTASVPGLISVNSPTPHIFTIPANNSGNPDISGLGIQMVMTAPNPDHGLPAGWALPYSYSCNMP